jgi:hypothetical protein
MKTIALLFMLALMAVSTAAYALDVPRSEKAKPADQAATGLATAESHNTTADEHVPA